MVDCSDQINRQTCRCGELFLFLFQAGIDPEATDLFVMMMEES